jgi:hypothetical protein
MRSGNGGRLPLFDGQFRLDVLAVFKSALADAMKACPLSRTQIAEAMNEALRREGLSGNITEDTLNKWAAPSDSSHHPTLRQLPFLLHAIQDTSPVNVLLSPFNARVAGPYEETLIREGLAREAEARARKAAKEARLERERLQREGRL